MVCILLYVDVNFQAFSGHAIISIITEIRYKLRNWEEGGGSPKEGEREHIVTER